MLGYIYRNSTLANFLVNRLRFRNLRCGKNVVINKCGLSQFSYAKDAWLAEGTRVDLNASLLHLDEGVNICKHACITPGKSGIHIGKRSKLQEFGRLVGEIRIGDDVIIAPNFYASSGIHVFNKEPHLLVSLQDKKHEHYADPCVIEDDCWIGMNVCVMPGVRIRRGSIIGAGAIVTKSTEPYGIYVGMPAKKIGERLKLTSLFMLDANIAEHLPYFYQGFDHYHYEADQKQFRGIMTSAAEFSIYTELNEINRIDLEVMSKASQPFSLQHNDTLLSINPGPNNIYFENIRVENKLLKFNCSDKLIVKKISFA